MAQDPRPGEEDGVHYNFSDRSTMEQMVADGEFIETAEFSGNMYGTSAAAVEAVAESGKVCILDIDVQGVRAVKESALEGVRFVFIKPPSLEVLEERLRARGTETEEAIEKVRARFTSRILSRETSLPLFPATVLGGGRDGVRGGRGQL